MIGTSRPAGHFTLQTLLGYPSAATTTHEPLRETAWLDGLRGVAAFLVMIYHFNITLWNPLFVEAPFGSSLPDNTQPAFLAFWRLPILRLWMCSGHAQVSVFFVLSGFVLSWGPLGSIQAGDRHGKVLQSLGSATFRRWIRLYVPCFAVALWQVFEMWFGLRDWGVITKRGNIFAQLWDYVKVSERFANPFQINRDEYFGQHDYDWTLWTIPYEFSGSMLVFGVLLAVSRFADHRKRTIVIAGVAGYACLRGEWNFWLFATGMLIANYVRNAGGFDELTRKTTRPLQTACVVMLIAGLLLAGVPSGSQFYTHEGYAWLDNLVPSAWQNIEGGMRLWWCWSGILFIFASCHLAGVRRLFESSFMRYLGRLSFMLYLTHRIVLNLLGSMLRSVVYSLIGRDKWIDDSAEGATVLHPLFTLLGYVLFLTILIPSCLVVAHWAEICIDKPSTKLARRVDDWFVGASPKEPAAQGENGSLLPLHAAGDEREMDLVNRPDGNGIADNAP